MSGIDGQLRALLDAAAGGPPHRVSAGAVHRQVVRRRVMEGGADNPAALAYYQGGWVKGFTPKVLTLPATASYTSTRSALDSRALLGESAGHHHFRVFGRHGARYRVAG